MSQELVVKSNGTGEMTKFNSVRKEASDFIIYFISGLFYVFAPFAGRHIDNFRSTMIERNSVNNALTSNAVSKKFKYQIKDNSSLRELLEVMKNSKKENIGYIDDMIELSKKMSNLIFGTSYSTNRFYRHYSTIEEVVNVYNRAYRNVGNVDWFYSEINNRPESVIIPKFSLTDLFGVKILHVDVKNKNIAYSHQIRYTKAIGIYIVSDVNIPGETLDELFEIQEKIDELKADLESYKNSFESIDEEIINAVKESIKIGQEKGESIVKILTSDSLNEKGIDLYQKALTMDW